MYGLRFRSELPDRVAQEFEGLIAAFKRWALTEHNEDGSHRSAERLFNFVPVGAMQEWPTATAPDAWLLCDGAAVSRVTYNTLFNVIGTTYGAGDGSLTFNLPDFRGRFALAKAAAGTGSVLAATGGALDHTHTGGSHSHNVSGSGTTAANGGFSTSTGSDGSHNHGGSVGASDSNAGISTSAGGTFFALDNHLHSISSDGSHTHSVSVSDHTHTVSITGTTDSASSGTTGAANPPYLVVNKIIFTGVVLNA